MQTLLINLLFSFSILTGGGENEKTTSTVKVVEPNAKAVPVLHCEVPCGIYGDSLRIALIDEHLETVEKAMTKIKAEKGKKADLNQVVRWVNNKEIHAEKIQEIVSQYFLHQRIKITDAKDAAKYKKYQRNLELLHQILVYAMKCKQGTDLAQVQNLKNALHRFEESYFHKHVH